MTDTRNYCATPPTPLPLFQLTYALPPGCCITPPPLPSQPYESQWKSDKLNLVFVEPDDGTAQRATRESLRLFGVVQESYLQGNGTHS